MPQTKVIRLRLQVPAEDYLGVYEGTIRWIQGETVEGTTVRFPAPLLRPFLTHAGVFGEFELVTDENNRLVSIRRVSA